MYNYLKVNKAGKTTYFSTNVLFGVQSAINDDDSLTGMYYDYLLISPYLVKENPIFETKIENSITYYYDTSVYYDKLLKGN